MTETITEVKESPILFSTPMVRAILEGRKTVTRRIVDIHPELAKDVTKWGYSIFTPEGHISARTKQKTETGHRYGEKFIKLKYGKPGDILWVRETWRPFLKGSDTPPGYWNVFEFKAGGDVLCPLVYELKFDDYLIDGKWRPSIHMPRAACRIRLEIQSITVERLQDITEEDAIREGINPVQSFDSGAGIPKRQLYENYLDHGYTEVLPKDSFQSLWMKINGAESWNANPWVWRIEFKKQ